MTPTPKVFISATTADLQKVREGVSLALLRMGCMPVSQESFPPDYRSILEMLRERIAECQAVIHVVGRRYGAEPDPSQLPPGAPRRSFTQLEYDIARELDKKLYVFVCANDFPYDPDDEPAELRERQTCHREAVLRDKARLHYRITTAHELEGKIRELQLSLQELRASVDRSKRYILIGTAVIALALTGIAGVMYAALHQGRQSLAEAKQQTEALLGSTTATTDRNKNLGPPADVTVALKYSRHRVPPFTLELSSTPRSLYRGPVEYSFDGKTFLAANYGTPIPLAALPDSQKLILRFPAGPSGEARTITKTINFKQTMIDSLKNGFVEGLPSMLHFDFQEGAFYLTGPALDESSYVADRIEYGEDPANPEYSIALKRDTPDVPFEDYFGKIKLLFSGPYPLRPGTSRLFTRFVLRDESRTDWRPFDIKLRGPVGVRVNAANPRSDDRAAPFLIAWPDFRYHQQRLEFDVWGPDDGEKIQADLDGKGYASPVPAGRNHEPQQYDRRGPTHFSFASVSVADVVRFKFAKADRSLTTDYTFTLRDVVPELVKQQQYLDFDPGTDLQVLGVHLVPRPSRPGSELLRDDPAAFQAATQAYTDWETRQRAFAYNSDAWREPLLALLRANADRDGVYLLVKPRFRVLILDRIRYGFVAGALSQSLDLAGVPVFGTTEALKPEGGIYLVRLASLAEWQERDGLFLELSEKNGQIVPEFRLPVTMVPLNAEDL